LKKAAFVFESRFVKGSVLNRFAALFSGLVSAHEADALRGVGHVVFPVVFVFDGNVAGEILAFQFIQNTGNISDAGAVGNVVRVGRHFAHVMEMHADDMALQNFQAFHGLQTGVNPMAGVGARADARVAVFDDAQNVIGIPHFVIGVGRLAVVVVEADADVVFLDEFFNRVQRADGFGGDAVKVEFFCELKNFARSGFVIWDVHDAVIHGADATFLEMLLDLGDDLVG
jgi:hypothetical protein